MKLLKENKIKQDNPLIVVYVSTKDLNPNSYNPNVHSAESFDLLVKSVMAFGLTQPIVVRKETLEIIDGENRWRVASVLGMEDVPVCFLSLTDEEMVVATIIHNRARGTELVSQIDELDKYLMNNAPHLAKDTLLYGR